MSSPFRTTNTRFSEILSVSLKKILGDAEIFQVSLKKVTKGPPHSLGLKKITLGRPRFFLLF